VNKFLTNDKNHDKEIMAIRTVSNLNLNKKLYKIYQLKGQTYSVQMEGNLETDGPRLPNNKNQFYDLLCAKNVNNEEWIVYELLGKKEGDIEHSESRTHFFNCKEEAIEVFREMFRSRARYEFGSIPPTDEKKMRFKVLDKKDKKVRAQINKNKKKTQTVTRQCRNGFCDEITEDSVIEDEIKEKKRKLTADLLFDNDTTMGLSINGNSSIFGDDDDREFSMSELSDINDLRDDDDEDDDDEDEDEESEVTAGFFDTTNISVNDSFLDSPHSSHSDFSNADSFSLDGKLGFMNPPQSMMSQSLSTMANQMALLADAFGKMAKNAQ
jgi:hypothetical protein